MKNPLPPDHIAHGMPYALRSVLGLTVKESNLLSIFSFILSAH